MVVVVYQQFLYDFASLLVLRDHLLEACSLFLREVKLHVTCHFLKLIKQLFLRSSKDIMNLMNLVQLISSWKERSKCEYFEEDATDTPIVHLMIVVSICQEALRWPVPSGGDILCEWRL